MRLGVAVVIVIAVGAAAGRGTARVVRTAAVEVILQLVGKRHGLAGGRIGGDVVISRQNVRSRTPARSVVLPRSRLRRTGIGRAVRSPEHVIEYLTAVHHQLMRLLRELGGIVGIALPVPRVHDAHLHFSRRAVDVHQHREDVDRMRRVAVDDVVVVPEVLYFDVWMRRNASVKIKRQIHQPARVRPRIDEGLDDDLSREQVPVIGNVHIPAARFSIRRDVPSDLHPFVIMPYADVGEAVPGIAAAGRTIQQDMHADAVVPADVHRKCKRVDDGPGCEAGTVSLVDVD